MASSVVAAELHPAPPLFEPTVMYTQPEVQAPTALQFLPLCRQKLSALSLASCAEVRRPEYPIATCTLPLNFHMPPAMEFHSCTQVSPSNRWPAGQVIGTQLEPSNRKPETHAIGIQ